MSYIALTELRRVPIPFNKSAGIVLGEARSHETAEVFLSHSHLDDNDLAHAIALIEQFAVTVRVDIRESAFRGLSGGTAAPVVRVHIASCPKLVVALTRNIIGSRWIPWEIGLADGLHGVNSVALLPLRLPNVAAVPWKKST